MLRYLLLIILLLTSACGGGSGGGFVGAAIVRISISPAKIDTGDRTLIENQYQ